MDRNSRWMIRREWILPAPGHDPHETSQARETILSTSVCMVFEFGHRQNPRPTKRGWAGCRCFKILQAQIQLRKSLSLFAPASLHAAARSRRCQCYPSISLLVDVNCLYKVDTRDRDYFSLSVLQHAQDAVPRYAIGLREDSTLIVQPDQSGLPVMGRGLLRLGHLSCGVR